MTGQLDRLGFSFDWERSFLSSDANMYRWSQWLFLVLLEAGLIYHGTGNVDWCDNCETTLASIQVEAGGTCWRCHGPVRLIELPQWYLRISAYLHENDARLQERADSGIWDEVALASQQIVLGRVDGVEVSVCDSAGERLTVFTPYGDALSEARFVLLSARHPDVERWASDAGVAEQLEQLRAGGWERSAREAETIPVIDTGRRVAGPDGSELPVLVSPVVDSRFGPTAVLGIPSRDRTDEVLAGRLGIEVPEATSGTDEPTSASSASDNGASASSASAAAGGASGSAPLGEPAVRYRAFDFVVSRQRSWGTPIPIVYCDACGTVPVPRDQLPVLLPLDIHPTGTGNPLAEMEEFVNTTCPACGGPARRETDTLDCHFDALWLWVPACVPPENREDSLEEIFALPDLRHWLPSERLVAGSDSGNFVFDQRTVTKALRDIGPLAFLEDGEPFAGCLFHEMVISDGPQDEQASGQRGRPGRADRALRRGHGAPGGAVRGAPAALAELERLGGAALPPLPHAGVGVLARAHRARDGSRLRRRDRGPRGGRGRRAGERQHGALPGAAVEVVRERRGEDHRGHGDAGDAQRGAQRDASVRPHQGLRETRALAGRSS